MCKLPLSKENVKALRLGAATGKANQQLFSLMCVAGQGEGINGMLKWIIKSKALNIVKV